MKQDIQLATESPAAILSSPALQKLRRISLGTVQWSDRPPVKYLPAGLTLTDEQRAQGEGILSMLRAAMDGNDRYARRDRFALVAKMLLAYPIGNASQEVGKARGEAYQIGLDGIPPWAVAEAIRQWHRGEAGDFNYSWAPSPAILRQVASQTMETCQKAAKDLADLLNAKPLEDAMKRDDQPINQLVPKFRKV